MNLKKRIYLLTPILVMCCLIAAGMFVKETAVVEAAGVEVLSSGYKATLLRDIIDYEKTDGLTEEQWNDYEYKEAAERFDIVEFDVDLFDYDGREWNAFNQYNYYEDHFLAFQNGNTRGFTDYPIATGGNKALTYNWTGVNLGGDYAKQGIVQDELDETGIIKFNTSLIRGASGLREHMLFDPNFNNNTYNSEASLVEGKNISYKKTYAGEQIDLYWNKFTFQDHNFDMDQIRPGTYQGKFEFVYDKETGYYTYNSSQNHAQFNASGDAVNGITPGKIELYAETLGCMNGTVDQFAQAGTASVGPYGRLGGNGNLNSSGNKDYCLNSGTDSNNKYTFAKGLKISKFNIPSTNSEGKPSEFETDAEENLEYGSGKLLYKDNSKVEYLYIKFAVCSVTTNNTTVNAPATFQVIFCDKDSVYPDGQWKFDNTNVGKTFENSGVKYHKYIYEYTLKNTWQTFELKIPMNTIDFTVASYTIVPVNGLSSDVAKLYAGNSWDNSVRFTLMELGLGYNSTSLNSANGVSSASVSSFLPLLDISESTFGDNSNNVIKTADERLTGWMADDSNLTDSTNTTATRACENNYNQNGLTGIPVNYGDGKENTAAHFGMVLEVDFFVPTDRKDQFGQDIKFSFTGDDDLWVFIDNKLVLDVGGTHTAETAAISITNRRAWYQSVPLKVTGKDSTESISTHTIYYTDAKYDNIFAPGKHTMKIFYMERASGASNCFMSFNLPQIPDGGLTVSAEAEMLDGTALPKDLNADGIIDDNIVVKEKNDKIAYYYGTTEKSNALVTYTYEATYVMPKAYYENAELYSKTYQLYKTSNPDDTVVSDLKLTENSAVLDSANGEYTVKVQFEVPVGYTGTIILPDQTEIISVKESVPTDNNVTKAIKFSGADKITIDPSLKYVSATGENFATNVISNPTMTEYDITYGDDLNFSGISTLNVGDGLNETVSFKTDFTNYYETNYVTVQLNKKVEYKIAEFDKDSSNNFSKEEEKLEYINPGQVKNDFENMRFNFKISYYDLSEQYTTTQLKYEVYDGENLILTNYTSSEGTFYMTDGFIVKMYIPMADDGKAHIKVEELSGNKNLPGNYTYDSTVIRKIYNGTENIISNADLDEESPILTDATNDSCQYEFVNKYTWNIDFITNVPNKGVTMEVDEDIKVIFHNKLDDENWLDGEGSADNNYGDGSTDNNPKPSK